MILIQILSVCLSVSQNILSIKNHCFFFPFVFVLVFIFLLTQGYGIDLSSYSMTLCAKVVFSLCIWYYDMIIMLFLLLSIKYVLKLIL